jgi:hypothetical protein
MVQLLVFSRGGSGLRHCYQQAATPVNWRTCAGGRA